MIEELFNSVEVEVVTDVLFINFAEELVVFEITKPADPADALL